MKKLRLNLQRLSNVEVLSREQLKRVLGGSSGSGSGDDGLYCGEPCRSDMDCRGFCYKCGIDNKCYTPPAD